MNDAKRWILFLYGLDIVLNFSAVALKGKCVPWRSFRRIIGGKYFFSQCMVNTYALM